MLVGLGNINRPLKGQQAMRKLNWDKKAQVLNINNYNWAMKNRNPRMPVNNLNGFKKMDWITSKPNFIYYEEKSQYGLKSPFSFHTRYKKPISIVDMGLKVNLKIKEDEVNMNWKPKLIFINNIIVLRLLNI